MDVARYEIRSSKPLVLTTKEFEFLKCLLRRQPCDVPIPCSKDLGLRPSMKSTPAIDQHISACARSSAAKAPDRHREERRLPVQLD